MTTVLNWFVVLLILATSVSLLLSRDWRWNLAILSVQYLGVFWFIQAQWPTTMAATKLVTGWMACAILGITQVSAANKPPRETSWPEGHLFRLFASGLVILTIFAAAPRLTEWLGGVNLPLVWGGLLLIGMGLLHLGITSQPLWVTIALLTLLSGFEILYSAVEGSILVAALLAVINLGLALAASYMVTIQPDEDVQ